MFKLAILWSSSRTLCAYFLSPFPSHSVAHCNIIYPYLNQLEYWTQLCGSGHRREYRGGRNWGTKNNGDGKWRSRRNKWSFGEGKKRHGWWMRRRRRNLSTERIRNVKWSRRTRWIRKIMRNWRVIWKLKKKTLMYFYVCRMYNCSGNQHITKIIYSLWRVKETTHHRSVISFIDVFISPLLSNPGFKENRQREKLA